MSLKKTITIPASAGSNQLSEVFGKISFSSEVREMMSSLNAEISVRYIAGAEKPVVAIVSNGKPVCSLEEFKALSGYRRFVNEAIKEIDRESSTNEKVKLVGFFHRACVADGIVPPARMLEQNLTRFNQTGAMIKVVLYNLETIDLTVDNMWKTYLVDQGTRIIRVLFSTQKKCMGPDVIDRDYVTDELFDHGVPKWLYTKFQDKNFTNNLKIDSLVLLFPKNNYLKSIALSMKELRNEPFMTKNAVVLVKSGGIIALSRTDYSALFPRYQNDARELVEAYLDKYEWVCTNPYTSEELLATRETGKMAPVFREAQPPKQAGQNQRPESEAARVCRLIGNILGKIQATWNGIQNFVVPIIDPKKDFWVELYANAVNWDITPTNSIYNCIRAEGNLGPLDGLRNNSSQTLLTRISDIVAQTILVPHGTSNHTVISMIFRSTQGQPDFVQRDAFNNTIEVSHPIANLDVLESLPVTTVEIGVAKSFLGIRETVVKTRKISGSSSVRLHSTVLNELKPIKAHAIYDPVVGWLMSTFKTGNRSAMQLVAAERVLGEVLKYQKILFEEYDEEYELQEIEAYYSDEE